MTDTSRDPIYRLIDASLFARAVCAGVARWEPFHSNPNLGEICMGGLRFVSRLEHGYPVLSECIREDLEIAIKGKSNE
jgi:hypothetical protein